MTDSRKATSLVELPAVAQWIISKSQKGIILFEGNMGVGKTTLIKALCASLGVEDEVSSPTYSLVNEYTSNQSGTVYHFDLYRLEDEVEALDIGIEEYLDSGNFCLIEWPEKIRNLLPAEYTTISINVSGDERQFVLKTNTNE